MRLIPFRLRTFHRWHALVMSLVVVMSASSGLIHTWMAHTQAPPPPARPVGEVSLTRATVSPASLPGPASGVSLRTIGNAPWWQVIPTDGGRLRWFDAQTGAEDGAADERYAREIAHSALGTETVTQDAYLTAFDSEYLAIFRILPVYRFSAGDTAGTRVYVSTLTGSVTRLNDDRWQFEAMVFTLLHKWMLISKRTVRDWALMIAMTGLVVLALSGLALFWQTRRAPRS